MAPMSTLVSASTACAPSRWLPRSVPLMYILERPPPYPTAMCVNTSAGIRTLERSPHGATCVGNPHAWIHTLRSSVVTNGCSCGYKHEWVNSVG